MLDDTTRNRVQSLIDAVRERPTEFPAAEVLDMAGEPVAVSIDRSGEDTVAFLRPRPDARFESLTPREYEVATLVAAGFANRQIADALFISVATVKDHVHAVLGKTDLASRSEVAAAWYGNL